MLNKIVEHKEEGRQQIFYSAIAQKGGIKYGFQNIVQLIDFQRESLAEQDSNLRSC